MEINTQDYIGNQADPDDFHRDSHVHFSYEHELRRRDRARITILHKLSSTENPRVMEEKFKRELGAYHYEDFGPGGLNGVGG